MKQPLVLPHQSKYMCVYIYFDNDWFIGQTKGREDNVLYLMFLMLILI